MNTSESPSELMNFEVLIPTMDGHGIADRMTIQVPVTRDPETGEELLTPEAHEKIEWTQIHRVAPPVQ
ncbi:MAG: hypothetical protein WCO94_01045 [Verrucomicrobiota bacterium]